MVHPSSPTSMFVNRQSNAATEQLPTSTMLSWSILAENSESKLAGIPRSPAEQHLSGPVRVAQ